MTEIRISPLFRIFVIVAVLVFWGMAAVGWLAYRQEGAQIGLVMMGPLLAVGGYLLYALAAAPSVVQFGADALTIRRWLGDKTIRYDEITAVSQSYRLITITTQAGPVRLQKLFANDDARLIAALERHVPTLQQARAARLSGAFPIVVTVKPTAPIFSALVGLVLAAFGAFTLWYAWSQPEQVDAFQRWVMPIMGLLSLFFGGLFLYLLLWNYPRRTVFTADGMMEHFLLRTAVQSMQGVVAFEPGHDVRYVRGVPRQVYHIVFRYDDGRSYKWVPGDYSFPIDYIDAHEANRVAELTTQLRRAYLPDPPRPAAPRQIESAWGTAFIRRKLKSEAHDLIVAEEDYGEHHASAETIHFVTSRPLHGLTRFRTTNGNVTLSADGRFLLLQDPHLLLLFDLANGTAVHRRIDKTHVFLHAEFTADGLVVRTFSRTGRQRHSEPPLPPPQAMDAWHPGLGPVEAEGDFPSAYPGRRTIRRREERPSATGEDAAEALAIIARAKTMPVDDYAHEFETLRDGLNALNPATMAIVLGQARELGDHHVIDLLVTVLADKGYPPALPAFVDWLDHDNDEVRFAAAMALDAAANGRFGIDQMIDGGWVQHDQIRAVVPAIRTWWHSDGRESAPSLTAWLAQQAQKRPLTDQEKRYNFMELNQDWVFLDDGSLIQPEADYTLPRFNGGVHLVGGTVRLYGAEAAQTAVFEMDAEFGHIHKVVVKENGRWVDVTAHAVEKQPRFQF